MKILIIGRRGMLGYELINSFRENHEVIGLSSEALDITNRNLVLSKIGKIAPEIIINSSAFNYVDGAEKDEKLKWAAMQINSNGVGYLAEAAKAIGSIFISYSTDYVFDGMDLMYKEDAPTSPISNYGESKAEGEKNIIQIGGYWYIIRLSRMFGNPSKYHTGKESFFYKMLNLATTNKGIQVINDEISCFIYAPDAARATKKLVEEKFPYGIYHLVNEGSASWYDGIKELFNIFDINDIDLIPISSENLPRPAKRPKSSVLLNTKFPELRHFKKAIAEWKNKVNIHKK